MHAFLPGPQIAVYCKAAPVYFGRPAGGSWRKSGEKTKIFVMPKQQSSKPLVAVVMGSASDWDTMKAASDTLEKFGVAHESKVMSAHRTPALTIDYTSSAEKRGLKVFIAGAGGAAHLAGVIAAHTLLPVLGVPMSSALQGLDSLLSTVQMPGGIPVGTLAIGKAGATNAALLAIAILALNDPKLRKKLEEFREQQAEKVRQAKLG
jgi:5-(carboxyamino)imidazole ribonucleotide mutase